MPLNTTSSEALPLQNRLEMDNVLHFTNIDNATFYRDPIRTWLLEKNGILLDFLKLKYGEDNVILDRAFDQDLGSVATQPAAFGIYLVTAAFEAVHDALVEDPQLK